MTTSAESMAAQTAHYLDLLDAGAPDDAWLIVSWPDPDPAEHGKKPPMLSAWYRMHQRRLMLRRIAGLAPTHNVYVNLGLRRPTCPPGRAWRGKCADVSAIPGLWVDMDHAGGVHTTADLPSREEPLGFLQAMPFAWSLLIDTTGGAHAYVLFREPWLFDVPEDPIRYNPSDIEEAPWLLRAPQASILRPEPEDDAPPPSSRRS